MANGRIKIIDTAYANSNAYTDEKITALTKSVPEIIFQATEPESVPENTIVMVYEE